ncbi:hypothetical protein R3Q06_18715 [Rhodococcus erythropolis]|uniref:hypothetical protein n=1 Tax=Rhodococcus erythropolis TaxID=1833 RepID=UPI002949754E|nr:hypothetical protein [Rhodococcus erythropolis]MDV6275533.1 hypothetical protein [Rhodococcus erythropolis]
MERTTAFAKTDPMQSADHQHADVSDREHGTYREQCDPSPITNAESSLKYADTPPTTATQTMSVSTFHASGVDGDCDVATRAISIKAVSKNAGLLDSSTVRNS